MKSIYYCILSLFPALVVSCGHDVVYDLPDGDKFNHVYLLQAVDNPRPVQIFMIEGETQTTNYTAFYSGLKAPKNIRVGFEINTDLVQAYNEANQTNYEVMPEGSYELEASEAVIPAGQSRTEPLKLRLRSFGYIEAFKEYLLPLVLKTDDMKMNESLNVIYYLVSASYKPGEVPRVEVCGNVTEPIEMFAYNDVCLLTRTADGKLRRYGYDSAAGTFSAPTVVREDWTKELAPYISAGGGNTLQVVNQYWTWIVIPANEDGTQIKGLGEYSSVITGGCGIFDRTVWNAHPTGFLARWGGTGNLQYYPMTSDLQGLGGSGVTTEFNFGIYDKIFVYGRDLMGIDAAGDLWLHKFSGADNTFGSPVKKGSGWNDFTHVTPFGTDLVARDRNGKLWLYEFDLRGFWALKPIS